MCTWGEVFIYVINVGQEQKGAKVCALRDTGLYQSWFGHGVVHQVGLGVVEKEGPYP